MDTRQKRMREMKKGVYYDVKGVNLGDYKKILVLQTKRRRAKKKISYIFNTLSF